MSVLVTGAGLIGGLAARLLAARGERVVLADLVAPAPAGDAAGRIVDATCDVADVAALDRLVTRHEVTAIVHTAAMLSTAIRRDPFEGARVNVLGVAACLDVARRRDLRRVVIASSATVVYSLFAGRAGEARPIPEDAPMRLVGERPASLYAATKLAAEHLMLAYADSYGVDAVALRLAAVIGGSLERPTSVPGRLLAKLAEAAARGAAPDLDDPLLVWGGEEEFVDARDCARAMIAALDAPAPRQRVYAIAEDEAYTLERFLAVAACALPGLAPVAPPAPSTGFAGFPHRRPARSDLAAARDELGFRCRHSLEDAIRYWTGA
ncbi:MAG: NAD(P)-dependent oxidoreductase [Methylobacteriaceae bacterium]|nr:NAD(P)-dependent oxidoreductase [Methylobacteriaceae bacterium]